MLRLYGDAFCTHRQASGEETLFGWIVSDFGLNDAIESGLGENPAGGSAGRRRTEKTSSRGSTTFTRTK